MKFLLVDDSADQRESMAALLRLRGHEARAVGTTAEALKAMGEESPDVVLLDRVIPLDDARRVPAAVSQVPEWRRVKVLVCTAHRDDEPLAWGPNVVGVLVKPAMPEDVERALEKAGVTR